MSTATVETLTAEVRVLMVGNRQITLSVARQLDEVPLSQIEPFGRVRIDKDRDNYVIGKNVSSGALAIAHYRTYFRPPWIGLDHLDDLITVCDAIDVRDEYLLNFHGRDIRVDKNATQSCGNEDHRSRSWSRLRCEHWKTNGLDAQIEAAIALDDADRARNKSAAELPLIVLAGLR